MSHLGWSQKRIALFFILGSSSVLGPARAEGFGDNASNPSWGGAAAGSAYDDGSSSAESSGSGGKRARVSGAPSDAQMIHRTKKRALKDLEANGPFTPNSHNIALNMGQVFLMGDLGSSYRDNLGFQASYTYGVSDIFGFNASVGYSSHSEGAFSLMHAVAGVRANLNWYDKIVPNAVVGLGFYRPSYQLTSTTTLDPILFGLHLGVGADLVMTKQLFFGAALHFNDIFSNSRLVKNQNFEVGGAFMSFHLRAGVTF